MAEPGIGLTIGWGHGKDRATMRGEEMGELIPIMQERVFSLEQARVILPAVKRITHLAVQEYEELEQDIEFGVVEEEEGNELLADIVEAWAEDMAKLGCEAMGLWLVDFDNGQGCFCWEYGEKELNHYHTYEGGFDSRTAIV